MSKISKPKTFNELLRQADVDPFDVRLIRHRDLRRTRKLRPYELWLKDREEFERYQETQNFRYRKALRSASYWAVFVGLNDGKTLFVGLYEAQYVDELPRSRPQPNGTEGLIEKAGTKDLYRLTLKSRPSIFNDLIGRLCIDWGEGREKKSGGYRARIQYADRHNKPITELCNAYPEVGSRTKSGRQKPKK